ncbi:hypothetical protein DFH94DRAFT_640509 [Russula ochroleuca]|uniref:Uncharacterized protein n=1 Tax=Russula ochroleuca TaxID=152965 RepID=A0A9P5JUI4_9AGAM|nr:hypothetical protein DFH94DRAFT_640509 [Russula ochroleuca]
MLTRGGSACRSCTRTCLSLTTPKEGVRIFAGATFLVNDCAQVREEKCELNPPPYPWFSQTVELAA